MEQTVSSSRDSASGSYVHEVVAPAHEYVSRPAPTHGKSRAAMIWGVGSTVLSVLGFLAWGLFEQYNSSLAELRADLKHFNEASSTFVKKDSMTRFRDQAKAQYKEMQSVSLSNKQLEENAKDLYNTAHGGWLVMLVLLIVVGAPLVEELVYRGLLMGAARRRVNTARAGVL